MSEQVKMVSSIRLACVYSRQVTGSGRSRLEQLPTTQQSKSVSVRTGLAGEGCVKHSNQSRLSGLLTISKYPVQVREYLMMLNALC